MFRYWIRPMLFQGAGASEGNNLNEDTAFGTGGSSTPVLNPETLLDHQTLKYKFDLYLEIGLSSVLNRGLPVSSLG
jgi:hypothetical protein